MPVKSRWPVGGAAPVAAGAVWLMGGECTAGHWPDRRSPGYGGWMIDTPATSWAAAARRGSRLGHTVEAHDAIGSTNDRVRELLDAGAPAGMVVVAEEQTAGRGRRGRTWISPPGRNVTASVGLRPRLATADAWWLGLAAALAAHAACARVAPVALKWPNDVVAADGRKLAGLLLETAVEGAALRHAVAGFGINVNWAAHELPPELAVSATSLAELAGAPVDRVGLLRALLDALEVEIDALEAGRSPLERYRGACGTLDERVIVEMPDRRIEGRAIDLDAGGSLLVETADGRTVAVASGEVVRVRRTDAT